MKLTIYRGGREIGGSCVELGSGNCRILVDLGIPLVRPDGNSFDLADHDGKTGPDLVKAGVLPDVAGLYHWQDPGIAGVLISHGHQDHYGFLEHVHPAIPVFMGEGTAKLIEITSLFKRSYQPAGTVKTFGWPDSFTVGNFTITPHLVDHSCFGAFAFEIEADGKRVVYSGDFRDHGHIGKATDVMLNRVAPGADALLLEGTMTGRSDEKVLTEQEVADQAADICRRSPSLVAVYQSGQNVSRAVSFFKAALATDRTLVLDVYTAHVLKELGRLPGGKSLPHPGNPKYRGIRVWYPKRLTDHLFRNGNGDIANDLARFKIKREEIAEANRRHLIFVRPGMEKDLRHLGSLEGGILIYSLWEGYKATDRTKGFLRAVQNLGMTAVSLHTSGHATANTLKRTVDRLNPKKVIPIHTFHPDRYAGMGLEPVTIVEDGKAINL